MKLSCLLVVRTDVDPEAPTSPDDSPKRCYPETALVGGIDRARWRLLPFERVLWHGARVEDVPLSPRWVLLPILVFAFAVVAALFAGLLSVSDLPGAQRTLGYSALMAAIGVGLVLLPRHFLSGTEYMLTDRRILWRRGRYVRQMDRRSFTYARLTWHPSVPSVGSIELVVAVPFGPLSRRLRLVLSDVRDPDSVLAHIRGADVHVHADDPDVPLVERLDPGERVLWGGHPEGWLLGWRELATAALGVAVLSLAAMYGANVSSILVELEEHGLAVRSWTWVLFFLPVVISTVVLVAVGAALVWHGLWRARALGRDTDYLLTDRRLLIRRGRTELTIDRRCIVDAAIAPIGGGLHHVYLMLDSPRSRALADSGALAPGVPSREEVPPVLYEVRDAEALRTLILDTDALADGS